MANVIRAREIETDTTYEEGLAIDFGVSDASVGSKRLTMGHTIIPPGNRNRWHYHGACEAAMYIARGRVRVLWQEDGVVRHADLGPGSFFYVAPFDRHTQENLSDTEPVEMIFAYAGVANKEAAETVFVPDPRL